MPLRDSRHAHKPYVINPRLRLPACGLRLHHRRVHFQFALGFSLKFEKRKRPTARHDILYGIESGASTQGILAKYPSSESGESRESSSPRSAANCAASPNEVDTLSPNEANPSEFCEFCSDELAPPVLTGSGSCGNSLCNDSKTWMVKGDELAPPVVVGGESGSCNSPSCCNDSMTWGQKQGN